MVEKMFSLGAMNSHYNDSKNILNTFGIDFQENYEKRAKNFIDAYSEEYKKQSLIGTAVEAYNAAIKFQDYSFLLDDGAIIQFSYSKTKLRFAYTECPYDAMSYKEFLHSIELDYSECRDQFYEEYNQYLIEKPQKEHITHMRYDDSEEEYKEIIHPASHLHFGQNNSIRIPVNGILYPSSFVMLVTKQVYWEQFKEIIRCSDKLNQEKLDFYIKHIRFIDEISSNFFSENDCKELTLR